MISRIPNSRGVALLVVLLALMVSAASMTMLLDVDGRAKSAQRIAECSLLADDLLLELERPIQRWLSEKSATIVLTPDATEPRILVLRDRINVRDCLVDLSITAWDECGKVPLNHVAKGSPLRTAVPEHLLELVDEVLKGDQIQSIGLDCFLTRANRNPVDPHIYPRTVPDSPIVEFGKAAERTDRRVVGDEIALGGCVSTHNPPMDSDRNALAIINVNTAPIPLLEAALRSQGRGGLEAIVSARSEGRSAPAPGPMSSSARSGLSSAIQFNSASPVWSFRIDLTIDHVRRSWWAVYASSDQTWRCVQRLAIDE